MKIKLNPLLLTKRFFIEFIRLLLIPIKIFIPKSNVVVLSTFNRNVYRENTKYLFEYLSRKEDINTYWITDNADIKSHLLENGLKYISTRSPIKLLWTLIRSKIVIDSGNNFFNPFDILSSNKTIKISTSHGNGPKVTVSRFHPPNNHYIAVQQITNLYKFNYVNYPSDFSMEEIGQKKHLLPNHKIINLGYPRCDNYFNTELINERHGKKIIATSICPQINKDSKIILYTPTWRPYDYEFPLFQMDGFNLNDLDLWLEKRNTFLFFSIHSAQEPKNIPDSLTNIIKIDDSLAFYDTNEFMMEVDILLNDYSTTSTDFSILNRPQLFYMPDYEEYEKESGFIEDYKKAIPGREVYTYQDLISNLEYIFSNKYDYLKIYEDIRVNLLKKYYDYSSGDSSEKFYIFIKKILKN